MALAKMADICVFPAYCQMALHAGLPSGVFYAYYMV
jgi:hypothetical protein